MSYRNYFLASSPVAAAVTLMAAQHARSDQSFRVDPPVVIGKYYEQNGTASCSQINACVITFSDPPRNRRLTIQRVGCDVATKVAGLGQTLLSLDRDEYPFPRAVFLPRPPVSTFNDISNYSVASSLRYPVEDAPEITAFTIVGAAGVTINMACQIAGELSS